MNIKDFAEKFVKAEDEAWQNGNCDPLEKLEDPDVIYHLMAVNQESVGFEALKQQMLAMRRAVPNMRIEWKYLTGEGNHFALLAKTSGGKFTVQVPGLPPPTGKEVTANTLFLFRLKNGKIAEAWSNSTVTGLG